MNPLIQVFKFVTFTVLGIVTKKGWDWLTRDVDPTPGTKWRHNIIINLIGLMDLG